MKDGGQPHDLNRNNNSTADGLISLNLVRRCTMGTQRRAIHLPWNPRWGTAPKLSSVCLSVRLSVRPSVTCVTCDKTVERSVQIFTPYERPFSLVFWEEEWLVGTTPSTWNFGSTDPRWSEIADFQPIFARSSSAETAGEKSSINANRKFITRFPMSLRWSSYVAPKFPKGGLNNAKRPISV